MSMARTRVKAAAALNGGQALRPMPKPIRRASTWAAGFALAWLAGPDVVMVRADEVEEIPAPVAAPDEGTSTTANPAEARRMIEEALGRSAARRADTPTPADGAAAAALPRDLVVARLSAEVAARQLEARRAAQLAKVAVTLDRMDA